MKKYANVLCLVLALVCFGTFGFSEPAPFNHETDVRFKKVEQKKTLRFLLNDASTFPSGDTLNLKDQFGNNAILPAGSDILHAYYYVKTQLAATSGSPTLAVTCGSAVLLNATNETGVVAGALFDGNPAYNQAYTSATANGYVGTSNCIITATQNTGIFSGGKVYGYVEYVNVLP